MRRLTAAGRADLDRRGLRRHQRPGRASRGIARRLQQAINQTAGAALLDRRGHQQAGRQDRHRGGQDGRLKRVGRPPRPTPSRSSRPGRRPPSWRRCRRRRCGAWAPRPPSAWPSWASTPSATWPAGRRRTWCSASARTGKYLGLARARHRRPPIVTEHEAKSISQETTFARDVRDAEQLRKTLRELSEQVGRGLRKAELRGRTVKLKLRWSDFTTLTRQATPARPHRPGRGDLPDRAAACSSSYGRRRARCACWAWASATSPKRHPGSSSACGTSSPPSASACARCSASCKSAMAPTPSTAGSKSIRNKAGWAGAGCEGAAQFTIAALDLNRKLAPLFQQRPHHHAQPEQDDQHRQHR